MQKRWMLNLQRGFLQTQFSKDWTVVMLKFWIEHRRKNVAQINLSTKLTIAGGWCYRQLAKTELNAQCDRCRTIHMCPTLNNWNVLQTPAHSLHTPPKCFAKARPQCLVHDKMQYLETTTYAAFEILKEKFQYVSDQLELNSKQHQAVKGRFVSYLQ